jgi:DNA-binding transcriptional MerR regulator
MQIGRMTERTGVQPRMLRYYEEQRLIVPGRDSNGYRVYCEEGVRRIEQIRALAQAGVPIKFIKLLLREDSVPEETASHLIPRLVEYADVLQSRIDDMTKRREALLGYITELRPSAMSA